MTRQITTEAELDALPTGSVVLSRWYPNGPEPAETKASFQKRPDGEWYRGARASWVHPDGFLPATILHQPSEQEPAHKDIPAGHPGEQDVLERAAALLDAHAGMTDRAAEDGCRCGYPGTDEGRHQAEQLANAGLLTRPLPDREQIARAIFDVHNRLGRSDYDGLPRETSLAAADAVLALLEGEPT